MSSNEIDAALSRAHALVEDGKLDEARAILEPILTADKNNADAWWIYAHAVATPEEGRDALQNVLRLAPNYPGAAELMALAEEQEPVEPAKAPVKPTITQIAAQPTPFAPPTLPETHLPEPDLELETPTRQPAAPPPSRGLPIAPILAVIVIIILVVLVVLSQGGGTPSPTPTQAAILVSPSQPIVAPATEALTEAQPTVTALIVETTPAVSASEQAVPVQTAVVTANVSSTTEATSGAQTTADFSAIRSALSQFPIAQNGIVEAQTSVGNTLVVSVCTTPGRAMRNLLPQVMNTLAKQTSSLDASIQGIGTRMINCDQNTPLLSVAVDTASAQSYAQGKLTDAEFAKLWKPQT